MTTNKGGSASRSSKNGPRRSDKKGHDEEVMDTTEQRDEHPDLEHSDTGHHQYHEIAQPQKQQQLQRSLEASKQMLYGVFGNVITILEEYERRELAKHKMEHMMPKSDIYIPAQEHKTFEDIESNVDTQLLVFETQTRACPPEAITDVHEDLKRKTISWSAVREEMGITEIQQTDKYIAKLYEILAKGRTNHKPVGGQEVTKEVMKEGFQAMLHGEHDRAVLDKKFKTDPDKKANAPKTRGSEQLCDGANRITRARGDKELDLYLKEDLKRFEENGPNDLK